MGGSEHSGSRLNLELNLSAAVEPHPSAQWLLQTLSIWYMAIHQTLPAVEGEWSGYARLIVSLVMSNSKFLKMHQKTIRVQLREGPHFVLFISYSFSLSFSYFPCFSCPNHRYCVCSIYAVIVTLAAAGE